MQKRVEGMAWVGVVAETSPIDGADRIQRADVLCGAGGKWSGVVKRDVQSGEPVVVFLADSILPRLPCLDFMEKDKWRVRMRRMRGCPSEVLIMPQRLMPMLAGRPVGDDVTFELGVEKYEKEVPTTIGGELAGPFPHFVPKTDEPNFQRVPHLRDALVDTGFYSSVKYDGTSQTVFHRDGDFGACSRNWRLKENSVSAVWKLVERYDLREKLPALGNYAVQWECIGPGVQNNPLKLSEIEARVFNVYNIDRQEYLGYPEVSNFVTDSLDMPFVRVVYEGVYVDSDDDELRVMAVGVYAASGTPREGIVIRACSPARHEGERISFKVINLDYKEA